MSKTGTLLVVGGVVAAAAAAYFLFIAPDSPSGKTNQPPPKDLGNNPSDGAVVKSISDTLGGIAKIVGGLLGQGKKSGNDQGNPSTTSDAYNKALEDQSDELFSKYN